MIIVGLAVLLLKSLELSGVEQAVNDLLGSRVCQANIRCEEHDLVSLVLVRISVSITQLPLVLLLIAIDGKIRRPAVVNKTLEVVVVEDTLLLRRRPVTIVATVLDLGRADGVSTRDGSGQSPGEFLTSINVLNKDLLETIFAGTLTLTGVLGIGHAAISELTLLSSRATESE